MRTAGEQPEVKSVGNNMTFRRNLVSRDDVVTGVTALSDEVAARLRAHRLCARWCRFSSKIPTCAPSPGRRLCRPSSGPGHCPRRWHWWTKTGPPASPIRMLSVTAMGLTDGTDARQLSLLEPEPQSDEKQGTSGKKSLDAIRKKYGKTSIASASRLNNDLGLDPLAIRPPAEEEDPEP